jgi:hypothetical protein
VRLATLMGSTKSKSIRKPMSAIGPKRTSVVAPHMSAFGGKADILFAAHMSAFDPKRTFTAAKSARDSVCNRPARHHAGSSSDYPSKSCHGANAGICIGLSIVVTRGGGDMQRRGGSGKPVKGRHSSRPRARKTLTAHVSTDHPQEQLGHVMRERDEALEQRAATAEILRVICASPTDVRPVFQTIVRNAVSLCAACLRTYSVSMVSLCILSPPTTSAQVMCICSGGNTRCGPTLLRYSGRVMLTKSVVRLEDVLTDPDYDQRFPRGHGLAANFGGADATRRRSARRHRRWLG